ncbi:hypothetical protein ACFY0F_34800 [Streptomyces sp. NPDC001544]|uniref:hypothetical protein n=1 Tax=Streptomyces sp. NPDC001544 TaxID=3364584 RepID=UPI00369B6C60
MWPGQQPPGGEQNPQNNPYQQPGYQQPNPYQQPGYQQPSPYGQQPHWGPPAPVGASPPPQGGGGDGGDNRTKVVAIVAATAVVVAAGVTGFLVLGGKGDKTDDGAAKDDASRSASASPDPGGSPSGADADPRGAETQKPTIAGWKVVVNPKRGVAFDVPPDWEVQPSGSGIGMEDHKTGKPIAFMTGTALYKSKWCTSDDDKDGRTDDTELGAAGTKGASGAKNTDVAAINAVGWWVYGGYTQPDEKSLTLDKKATKFTTDSGIKGSYAWARSHNSPQKGKSKCASDGKAVSFGFKNSAGDFVSWVLYGATGVSGEIPDKTIMKIMSTVRLSGDPTG